MRGKRGHLPEDNLMPQPGDRTYPTSTTVFQRQSSAFTRVVRCWHLWKECRTLRSEGSRGVRSGAGGVERVFKWGRGRGSPYSLLWSYQHEPSVKTVILVGSLLASSRVSDSNRCNILCKFIHMSCRKCP